MGHESTFPISGLVNPLPSKTLPTIHTLFVLVGFLSFSVQKKKSYVAWISVGKLQPFGWHITLFGSLPSFLLLSSFHSEQQQHSHDTIVQHNTVLY
ncbi:hypothetical protein RJT34_19906 [Clitoria ternatea]|uniref:Uncharacterized protein n=1 Tax=Clitoria ternatea TaxID=43366 RepID=A0AAN9IS78_CLITE